MLQTLHGRFRRSKTSRLLDCGLWALRDCGRSCADCGLGALARQIFFSSGPKPSQTPQTPQTPETPQTPRTLPMVLPYWPLEQPASGFWTLQTLQNLALARLWALGSARLWAELRRLWARGSGAPNPFFLVARNCPSNASNPSNPSNASTLAMVVPYVWILDASDAPWTLQTLQNLARLWALGSARLWAELRRLWARGSGAPNPFFLVARNCPSNASNPSNPSNPSNASTLANGCAITPETPQTPRFRRSKTSHLPDCGLWALRDCGRSCAGCGLGALARQILFF